MSTKEGAGDQIWNPDRADSFKEHICSLIGMSFVVYGDYPGITGDVASIRSDLLMKGKNNS
jgi:hypothetical protein